MQNFSAEQRCGDCKCRCRRLGVGVPLPLGVWVILDFHLQGLPLLVELMDVICAGRLCNTEADHVCLISGNAWVGGGRWLGMVGESEKWNPQVRIPRP
eukprot:3500852-Rhodomonas_salina.1